MNPNPEQDSYTPQVKQNYYNQTGDQDSSIFIKKEGEHTPIANLDSENIGPASYNYVMQENQQPAQKNMDHDFDYKSEKNSHNQTAIYVAETKDIQENIDEN